MIVQLLLPRLARPIRQTCLAQIVCRSASTKKSGSPDDNKVARPLGKRWTPAEDQVLLQMVREGKAFRDIGEVFHASSQRVQNRMQFLKRQCPSLTHPKAGKPFTPEEDGFIVTSTVQKRRLLWIAAQLNRGPDVISRRRILLQAEDPRLPGSRSRSLTLSPVETSEIDLMRSKGISISKIAESLGRGKWLIQRYTQNRSIAITAHKQKWTVEASNELCRLRASGAPWADIAARLGRSIDACQIRLTMIAPQSETK